MNDPAAASLAADAAGTVIGTAIGAALGTLIMNAFLWVALLIGVWVLFLVFRGLIRSAHSGDSGREQG